ncbi:6-phosphogluconolactonase [Cupriavidus sp. UYMMa02A]|nr:6-phosphogluconolactonase [Cupriavidus sp. UYMMa02A]
MRQIELNDACAHADAMARAVACELERTLATKDEACLAISGDRLPMPLFKALQQRPLPWDRVSVMLVDERMVPLGHTDSNARHVCDVLLREEASRASFQPPVPTFCTEIGEIDASAVVAELNRNYRQPDVVVLGMGDDGHTASLFADAPELPVGLSLTEPPGYLALSPRAAPHRRVSLNLSALLGARRVLICFSGPWKKQVFDAATMEPTPMLPVSYLLHQDSTPVDVYWTQ